MSIDYMSMPIPELVRRLDISIDIFSLNFDRLCIGNPDPACDEILALRNAEILDYLTKQKVLRVEEAIRDSELLRPEQQALRDGIEGLREVQEVYPILEQHADNPDALQHLGCDFRALCARYPRAVAYLRAESWSFSESYARSRAGSRAMKAILRGEPYEAAIAEMESEWSSYCNEHMRD